MAAISQLFVPFYSIVTIAIIVTSAIVLSWALVSQYIVTIFSITYP